MAIIAEDGTGIVNAATYATVAFCDTYFTDRAQLAIATTWATAATADKEGSLRTATAYIDATYGPHYRGIRAGRVQGLLWPRMDALDEEGYSLPDLPDELQRAVCELAARAISAPLSGDAARGGRVKSQSVSGVASQEFFEGAQSETKYGVVAEMLASILDGTQGNNPQWNWG